MIKIRSNISGILKLISKQAASLSLNNYMKTYKSHQITRHHGFFKVDEYNHYDTDPLEL
jgi:hypothetical protein